MEKSLSERDVPYRAKWTREARALKKKRKEKATPIVFKGGEKRKRIVWIWDINIIKDQENGGVVGVEKKGTLKYLHSSAALTPPPLFAA